MDSKGSTGSRGIENFEKLFMLVIIKVKIGLCEEVKNNQNPVHTVCKYPIGKKPRFGEF